jgi:hypothetical protein
VTLRACRAVICVRVVRVCAYMYLHICLCDYLSACLTACLFVCLCVCARRCCGGNDVLAALLVVFQGTIALALGGLSQLGWGPSQGTCTQSQQRLFRVGYRASGTPRVPTVARLLQ